MDTKILVVDDEPQLEYLFTQKFRRNIRNKEFELSFALNGAEALEKLQQRKDIDIVLSDINMPEMDGLTFISKLGEINPMIKTVMVSAYGNMKNIRTAMNHGAFDFVTKPIDFKDLETTIKKAIKEVELQKLAIEARQQLSVLQQELLAASELQQSILPKTFSIFSEARPYEIYAEMIPAREVGGDFYDFFLLGDEQLGMVVGDVSGKGLASALFMAVSRGLLKAVAHRGYTPAECLEQVNFLLAQDNPSCMFVTLFYGVLDLASGELAYCNAGHNLPYLMGPDGEVATLSSSKNIALGVLEDARFESHTGLISAGEQLILYTDGITEAVNQEFTEFSKERFLAYLRNCTNTTAEETAKGMIRAIQQFADGAPQSDDITALVLRRFG